MPEARQPIQFRLRTLLLIVLAVAVTLGAARWLGAVILPFMLAVVGVWMSTRTKARHLLVWLVPSLWSICAFGSWHHPGDEYGMFVASALAAIWLVFLLDFGHLSEVYLLLIAAGALPMAGLGFILDRFHVSRLFWGLSTSSHRLGCLRGGSRPIPRWRLRSQRTARSRPTPFARRI